MKDLQHSAVLEKHANALTVVYTADSLGKDRRNVENLQLRAEPAMLLLRHRVRHNNLVQGRGIDTRNGIAAEDTVGDESVHFGGTLALEEFRSSGDGVGGIDQVVNKDTDPISDITDEHHAGIAVLVELNRTAFLEESVSLEQGEVVHSPTL